MCTKRESMPTLPAVLQSLPNDPEETTLKVFQPFPYHKKVLSMSTHIHFTYAYSLDNQ